MTFVNARIAAQPYIAGETFTAADVLYAGALPSVHGLALAGREEDQSTRGLRGALPLATGLPTGRGKGSVFCLNRARKRRAISHSLLCRCHAKGLFWRQRGRDRSARRVFQRPIKNCSRDPIRATSAQGALAP